ncbi:hypothetical protein [Oscillatoria salina]|uniref:hypothetical protein n=1 Tax=Oscillatoria salina TaxID=331517 RepID=UPI0013BC0951|nr:hypothetical protein [Oscillatoria salina]MBZ8180992.1 hypothetical protein [Oscillatoria salina IIICB1]NET89635.1 hypothetical protein [Kamptonema sp. SIO1D9]
MTFEKNGKMVDETNNNYQPNPELGNTTAAEEDNSVAHADSPNVNTPSVQKNIKNFQRIYLILVVTGLLVGVFVAWGVVSALNRFGLTDSQPQIEQTR